MLRPVALVLVLALPALAGCLDPFAALPTCSELAARPPSGNAPLVRALAAPGLAHRFALAMDDALVDGEPVTSARGDEVVSRWETRSGWIEVVHTREGKFGAALHWSREHWTPIDGSTAERDLRVILHDVGFDLSALGPIHVDRHEGRLDVDAPWQHEGAPYELAIRIAGSGVRGWENAGTEALGGARAQVALGPAHDFSRAERRVAATDAERLAHLAVECALREEGRWSANEGTLHTDTEGARVGVANESLAWWFGVYYGEGCDALKGRHVWIDAQTGAVLHESAESAGCVY